MRYHVSAKADPVRRLLTAATALLLCTSPALATGQGTGGRSSVDDDLSYYRVRSARDINTEAGPGRELRVLVSKRLARQRKELIKLARSLCRSGKCRLLFWDSDDNVPQTPVVVSPAQWAAEIGRYWIDRDNVFERFECYAFWPDDPPC